jgi:hypothetical protein
MGSSHKRKTRSFYLLREKYVTYIGVGVGMGVSVGCGCGCGWVWV